MAARGLSTREPELRKGMKVVPKDEDSASESEEESREIEEENTVQACILLSELLYLHKKVFEASSESAAQPLLSELAGKIGEAHAEELTECELVGDLLKVLSCHPIHTKTSERVFPCGIWKDVSGHFYSGEVIEIQEDSWSPRSMKSERAKFRRDQSGLVERQPNGTEKRMTISSKDSGKLYVVHGAQKFELQAYYDWDPWEHFEVLTQVWEQLNASAIGYIVVEAGPHANRFVHSLTVQVPPELTGNFSLVQLQDKDSSSCLPGDFGPCNSEEQFKKRLPARWRRKETEGLAGVFARTCGPNRYFRMLCNDYNEKTSVTYFYCGVQGLFDYPGSPDTCLDHVEIMLYLEMPPDETLMFTTPLGQGVAANAWRNAVVQFAYQRTMDVIFQVMLSYFIAPISRRVDSDRPSPLPLWWQFLLVEFLMCRYAVNTIVEIMLMIKLWTRERDDRTSKAPIPFPINAVTFMRFVIEVYCFMWGCGLAKDYGKIIWNARDPVFVEQGTCLVKHPMALCLLIFIKFLQFMMSLLNFKLFRTSLLPTWFAIKSRESATFLAYMVGLTFGCSLAYMALPYASTLEDKRSEEVRLSWMLTYFKPFFLMFRLNIMGDFSMDELMGRRQVLKVPANCSANETDCDWQMDTDGPESHNLEPYLQMTVCLLALIFPVIFLNVYVGLVGEAYINSKNNLLHGANSYVVASVHRELMHRQFWRGCCGGMFSFDVCRRSLNSDARGTFIRIPTALVGEALEVGS